tara:strand:- start:99 stop:587 length:489 start_codon:yes stop_codon:yes gene_type:complete
MPVNIHGKTYLMVGERVIKAHEDCKKNNQKIQIVTSIVEMNEIYVIMKAKVFIDDLVYTGHAQEKFDSTMINKTSALENCETSCIGRALASAGWVGSEFASGDEVANAIVNQQKPTDKQRATLYNLIKKLPDEDIQKEMIESAKECKTRWDMSMLIDKVIKM